MAKTLTGIVTSTKGQKTIAVKVQSHKTHPVYKKPYPVSKQFLAHDEKEQANEGDKVLIAETKPISARKRHVLERIIEKAGVQHKEEESSV